MHASLTLGYAINMLALAAAGLTLIPALIHALGPREWAEIAVAQAIGGFCGVITGFGWGLAGPAYVARADSAVRAARYFESLRGRALVGVCTLPVGFMILSFVIGRIALIPLLALAVTAAVAMSPAWFYVGVARPWPLIAVDTLPRTASTGAAIVILYQGGPVLLALGVQLIGIAVGVALASILIGRGVGVQIRRNSVLVVLRAQSRGMFAAGTSAAFAALPVVLVGIVSPAALPVYAVFDKVQRQFASAISPVVQLSQGFVARAEPQRRARAVARVSITVGALSLIGIAAFTIVGSAFLHLLVASSLEFHGLDVTILGVALALILFEQTFGHAVLATAGRMGQLAWATLIGAIVGLVLVAVGAAVSGALAALVGFEVGLATAVVLEIVTNMRSRSRATDDRTKEDERIA